MCQSINVIVKNNSSIDSSTESSDPSSLDSSSSNKANKNELKTDINHNNKPTGSVDSKAWKCSSIDKCEAIISVVGTLSYWQNKINKTSDDIDDTKDVFSYLSSSNDYRDIISGYHHILDMHLNGKNNKKGWKYINNLCQQRGIKCLFKNCKGYDRNQRDRENEKKDDKVDDVDLEYVFIRDTLDTIHSYLVHGGDSGHRYYKKEARPQQKLYKINKRPVDDVSGDENEEKKEKESGIADKYALFDAKMKSLKEWQKEIKQKGRNQPKSKFLTDVKNDGGDETSFDLLSKKFDNKQDGVAFGSWLKYMRDGECDTDVLLNSEKDDIVYSECKANEKIVAAIYKFIEQKNQKKTSVNDDGTAQYGFGKRLYYWEYFRNNTDKDTRNDKRFGDFYVAPRYSSFKNEILSKGVDISKWNDITYKAQNIKKQSQTLKQIEASTIATPANRYGIEEDSGLSLSHINSVMFYTNLTQFCTSFGSSFRFLSCSESLEELKKRNSHWFWLSKHLREVVECYGTQINGQWSGEPDKDIRDDRYFHGVSYLLFTEFSVNWFGPLSTSKQMEVATLFTTNTQSGIILELKQDSPYLRFFNVCLISCFGSEDERLFIGGRLPIQIASIRLLKDDINLKQIMHSLFIINSIIRGKYGGNDKVTASDLSIFLDLLKNTPNTFPVYVEKIWKKFVDKKEKIEINMWCMHQYYSSFSDFFISSKVANLLEFHKITKMFENCKQIISKDADYDEEKGLGEYSLSSSYISGLLSSICLINSDETNKIKKIIIRTKKEENLPSVLEVGSFKSVGWEIKKEKYRDTEQFWENDYQIKLSKLLE